MRLDPIYEQRRKAYKFLLKTIPLAFIGFWFLLWLLMPLGYWIGEGNDALALDKAIRFWKASLLNPLLVFDSYFKWIPLFVTSEPVHTTWSSFIRWRLPLLPTLFLVMSVVYLIVNNPYDYAPQYFGYGREARPSDLKRMGVYPGKYLYLGDLKGYPMRLPDTRSAFCIGAPLSGKTVGVVVPNILKADNACLFIHDPKGELAKTTSGYRATKGPVFILDFSLADKPEEGKYYPCWNPLNENNMPPVHKGRDSYIDTLIAFLIPDGPEGTDPYWVKAGRSCLTGLTLYLTNKVEQAKANDYFVAKLAKGKLDKEDLDVLESYYQGMQQTDEVMQALEALHQNKLNSKNYVPIGTWDPLPHNWVGREASFGMLLDLLNNWMFSQTKILRAKRDMGDMMAMSLDVWQIILDTIVNETFLYGYGRRALLELNQVLSLPDKQRASVLSMAQTGIELFKNSAIRDRTSSNDFTYKDLRGIKDPATGEYRPVTFYVNNEGGAVCTLFINMVCGSLMDKGPNEGDMGPFAVEFILDDFARMPKLQSIADGITFGRSKQNIFLVVVQDWHQISAKYGENVTDIILSSVAAKIIKRQNNPETRNKMMAGIMPLTRRVEGSHGGEVGFGPKVNPFIDKGGFKRIKDTVIGGTGILKLAMDQQLVLISGFYHLPIQAKAPLFYNNKELSIKSKIPPATAVPAFLKAQKEKEGRRHALDIQLDALKVEG